MDLLLNPLLSLGEEALTATELQNEADKIPGFLRDFKARGQGFPNLPKAKAQLLATKLLAERFKGQFKDIVVLGIGGSALGISCLRDALLGPWWNHHGKTRLFVLDNLDLVDEVEKIIDVDHTLFIAISKSGRTPETMAQYFYFRAKTARHQWVFITDPEEGELRALAKEEQIPTLDIPANVGGRFSVLSPVGLFPAALLGLDIEALLDGAQAVVDSFENTTLEANLPFQLAAVQYLLEWKHGIHMTALIPYSTPLATFSDWYAQLLGESIGKEGKGLTPLQALGATDQHSQLQLYNEGPKDKLFIFIEVEKSESSLIPQVERPALSYLSGITFHELLNTEKRATEETLIEYGKPALTIKIHELNARTLGELFMLFQCSIAFLGEFYRIDAFNQPGVERGKVLTKTYLSSSQ